MVKSLKHSGLLRKGVTQAIENETKEQWDEFPSILLGTLQRSLLGNMLACKGINITLTYVNITFIWNSIIRITQDICTVC